MRPFAPLHDPLHLSSNFYGVPLVVAFVAKMLFETIDVFLKRPFGMLLEWGVLIQVV